MRYWYTASLNCTSRFLRWFRKQKQRKTTISVHEILSDSTLDYPIILLFNVHFSNNFIFLFYRYYNFNVYFFNVCLHINRMWILARREKQKILNFLGGLYGGTSTWGPDTRNYIVYSIVHKAEQVSPGHDQFILMLFHIEPTSLFTKSMKSYGETGY